MRPGEVWLVRLPATGGREQAGNRPAVILQDDTYARASPLVVVVPFTSQLGAARFPATVQIEPSRQNGLTHPSVAMVFQIRAVDRGALSRRLGSLEPASLQIIRRELDQLLGVARH